MICTYRVQDGNWPAAMCWYRSRRWKSASAPTSSAASSGVSVSMPWSVLKWYLIQNRSPPALAHWYVCEPNPSMLRGTGDPPVGHEERDLVGRFRRQRPEVPLCVVVPQRRVRHPLLGPDEVRELH